MAEPKDASFTKMSFEFGIRAVPNRTIVPFGEEQVSCLSPTPLVTGNTERKPVSFTAGLPFTVVSRALESSLKNVWDTVLNGPMGGVV